MRIGDFHSFRQEIEARGWRVAPPDPDAPDLGAFGIAAWRLRSAWSPVGLEAELRFFGDIPHGAGGKGDWGMDLREQTWKVRRVALHAAGAAEPVMEAWVGTRAACWPDQAASLIAALDRLRG